jgi:hypothetical protein
MRHLSMTAGALAVISGITALVLAVTLTVTLAVTPALASTQSAKSVTGPEVLSGRVTGAAANVNNPTIPLTLSGVVSTTAPKFNLGGTSTKHSVPTKAGTLVVSQKGTPTTAQTTNARTCLETFTEDIPFQVVGSSSTGKFHGASGPGAALINFAGYAPKFTSGTHKGQCNFNANPLNKGAVATFLASIVLTVK